MNTIRSTWLGWGTLCIAGGGAYYFAKRSINADKRARHEADLKRRRLTESLEYSTGHPSLHKGPEKHKIKKEGAVVGSPAGEVNGDPAPTGHEDGDGRRREGDGESRFVAKEVYRARKGDRFS